MNRVGEVVDLFSHQKKEEKAESEAPAFDFAVFKKSHQSIYRKIRKERQAAFMHLKDASNYEQLLTNSVQAYCEKWYHENQ